MGKQTAVKNRLRALLAQQGEEIRCEVERVENLFTEKGMKVLTGLALPEREAKLVGALLKTYRHIEERISETNALVDELYEKLPSARLIQTVPGFGIFLAVLVAVEVEDIFELVARRLGNHLIFINRCFHYTAAYTCSESVFELPAMFPPVSFLLVKR